MQITLFDQKRSLRDKAENWIEENPHVYKMFERFALDMYRIRKPFSAKFLAERVRWECVFYYDEDFKINNNYTAYIARKLVSDYPELKAYIKLRETKY